MSVDKTSDSQKHARRQTLTDIVDLCTKKCGGDLCLNQAVKLKLSPSGSECR